MLKRQQVDWCTAWLRQEMAKNTEQQDSEEIKVAAQTLLEWQPEKKSSEQIQNEVKEWLEEQKRRQQASEAILQKRLNDNLLNDRVNNLANDLKQVMKKQCTKNPYVLNLGI